jgi:uncharacterized protein (DUF952 family)
LLHIASIEEWEAGRVAGELRPPSLEAEGFVHLSTPAQVLGPAGRYYAGRSDMLLLEVDPSRLVARLVFEDTTGRGEEFPHLYGPLPVAAVLRAVPFPSEPDGSFRLPDAFA